MISKKGKIYCKMRSDWKIGFACKFHNEKDLNFKTLKIKSLKNLRYAEKVEKIYNILQHNIDVLNKGIDLVSSWPKNLRMMRIGSDIFPCYTHEIATQIYKENLIENLLLKLGDIGEKIKKNDIRTSMHPGQFTMLVSRKDSTIQNSIKDIEYHAEIFRYMNINPKDQRNEINIHVGAKMDNFHEIFLMNFEKLSSDAKSWLSIENDEFSYGIYEISKLKDHVKILLDIHHHWIMYEKFIDFNDPVIDKITESWRGAVPELHYSLPKKEYCGDLLELEFHKCATKNKKKLREHSDYCWHENTNKYVTDFLSKFDIMIEAKAKQLASHRFYEEINFH